MVRKTKKEKEREKFKRQQSELFSAPKQPEETKKEIKEDKKNHSPTEKEAGFKPINKLFFAEAPENKNIPKEPIKNIFQEISNFIKINLNNDNKCKFCGELITEDNLAIILKDSFVCKKPVCFFEAINLLDKSIFQKEINNKENEEKQLTTTQ